MGLSIKNAEAEELARQLATATATATGESLIQAILVAVRERLDRVRNEDTGRTSQQATRLRKISREAAGRWVEPYRSADHGDLRYDQAGLPR
jgi:antitoxin VapB